MERSRAKRVETLRTMEVLMKMLSLLGLWVQWIFSLVKLVSHVYKRTHFNEIETSPFFLRDKTYIKVNT